MKKYFCFLLVIVLLASLPVMAEDEKKSKQDEKRAKIDGTAQEALDELFAESPDAKKLYDEAVGWAVFDNLKIAIGISGGGGAGVAVDNGSASRTYMKMGTVGIGLGLGGQKFQVVFLFENEKTLTSFVEKGWQADASAHATAGNESAGARSGFIDGVAVYQITESGLMAHADIAGTKYWKDKKLNK